MVGRPATQRGGFCFFQTTPGRQAGAATVFRWRSTRVFGTDVTKIAPVLPRPLYRPELIFRLSIHMARRSRDQNGVVIAARCVVKYQSLSSSARAHLSLSRSSARSPRRVRNKGLPHTSSSSRVQSKWGRRRRRANQQIRPTCRSLTPRASDQCRQIRRAVAEAGRAEIRWRMTHREPFTMRWTERDGPAELIARSTYPAL
jgi:hypothetical protein